MPRLAYGICVVLLGTVACKRENPRYCDTPDDCAVAGSTCSATHECVAPGDPDASIGCDPENPMCPASAPLCRGDDGICVECLVTDDCTERTAPICPAGGGACGDCGGDGECAARSGGFPFCQGGDCVACRDSNDCDQAGATPVCAGGVCRGCESDGECSRVEGVCDEGSGRCAAESAILFVVVGGVDGPCTKLAPCGLPSQAMDEVTATRRFIKIGAGSFQDRLVVQGRSVEVVGAGAAASNVFGNVTDKPVLEVGDTSVVGVTGVGLRGAVGTSAADGLRCAGKGVDQTKIHLADVAIVDNGGDGIDASGCRVDLERVVVASSTFEGVKVDAGRLVMRRGEIKDNRRGGLKLVASDFTVENVLVTGNGRTDLAPYGGVWLQDEGPAGAAASRLEYLTVAGNKAMNASTSGLRCFAGATPVRSTIVAQNVAAAGNQVLGMCVFSGSLIDAAPALPGSGNQIGDPKFVDPALDFHIQPSSACATKGIAPLEAIVSDFEGDPRPNPAGSTPDCGADEIP
jgi:hypothetical protein